MNNVQFEEKNMRTVFLILGVTAEIVAFIFLFGVAVPALLSSNESWVITCGVAIVVLAVVAAAAGIKKYFFSEKKK